MTDRRPNASPMPTDEERAPSLAAHAAAREEAEYLDTVFDGRVIGAAFQAGAPKAQALALRQAADEAGAWSGAAEWLRRRADRIETEAAEHASAMRARRERERITITVYYDNEDR